MRAEPVPGGLDCMLLVDRKSGAILRSDGICDRRVTPMSTFKLAIAVVGFDAGILKDAHEPLWPYRPAYQAPKRARKAIDPTRWLDESIVWYSQEITRKLGAERFGGYVTGFGYGNHDVTGNKGAEDGLTQSWLSSSLAISPEEQVGFLRRLLDGSLPARPEAQAAARSIVPAFVSGGWRVWGKTGSGWLRDGDGRLRRSRPVGWFVGWARKGGRDVIFARLRVGTAEAREPLGLTIRRQFLAELPQTLD